MYGDRHPLLRKSRSEKFIWGLTLPQLFAVLAGARLSMTLWNEIPALPVGNIVLKHIHHGIPLYIAALLFILHDSATDRPVAHSVYEKLSCRLRRRKFSYGKRGEYR